MRMIKKLTNRELSALFFAGFIVFFLVFAYNRYTMNIVMGMVCLNFALAFKTWQLIREVKNG